MRRYVIALLSVTVLLLALAAGPASGHTAERTVCEAAAADADGDDRVLVGAFPNSSEPIDDGTTVYPGTEISLVLCDGDEPQPRSQVWSVVDGDGFEILDERETSVVVRITAEDGAVRFTESIDGAQVDDGFGVELVDANPASPSVGPSDPVYGIDAEAYEANETAFLDARTALEEARTNLNATAEAIREGDTDFGLATGRVEAVNETWNALAANASAFRSHVFDQGVTADTPGTASRLVAIADATDERRTESADGAKASLEAYDAALDERESTLGSSIRWNVLPALGAGLFLGLAAGLYLPYREGESTLQQSKLTADAQFSKRAVVLPVVAGLLLVVGTVIALAVTDALAVFEVIL